MTEEIDTPLGEAGSGRRRYGAAMALHRKGVISDAVLEVYRICSALDRQDPDAVLRALHLPAVTRAPATPSGALRRLVTEIDLYLARKTGPGLAELRAAMANATVVPAAATAQMHNAIFLQDALAMLGAHHSALAAALAAAAPCLDWTSKGSGGEFLVASLMGDEGPLESSEADLSLLWIASNGLYAADKDCLISTLCLPFTGPHDFKLASGLSSISKPADSQVWVETPHMLEITSGPAQFLGLIAHSTSRDRG